MNDNEKPGPSRASYYRNYRQNETEIERQDRLNKVAERMRLKRAQQRVNSTDRSKINRLSENEIPESERNSRLQKKVHQQRIHRLSENPEQRRERYRNNNNRRRELLLNETNETRQTRLNTLSLQRTMRSGTLRIGLQNPIVESTVEQHHCGPLNIYCSECKSKNFIDEMPRDKKFTTCCQKGKVKLNPLKPVPALVYSLMNGTHERSKNFMENVRSNNSALAFASMGAQIKSLPGFGPYCYKIQGQVYHSTSNLHPPADKERKYAQIYILDPDEARNQRMSYDGNKNCDATIMEQLDAMLREINSYAEAFKMMHEVEQEEELAAHMEGRIMREVTLSIVSNSSNDKRRYNAPRVNEIAIVFDGPDGNPPFKRDIRIHSKGENKTIPISILNQNCDPMTYPLLFPYNDPGWHTEIMHVDGRARVSQAEYYSYRLSIRDEFNPLLSAGKLTQQFIVDCYAKAEANRLNYIERNQKKLRVEQYSGLMDHIQNRAETEGVKAGKAVILPSSFTGSPRNMNQNYQDAMAIVRKKGKPDLFITMTCNPKWDEITKNLEAGQSPEHRPDLVARVFNIKYKKLMKMLTEEHVLGVTIAHMYVIEFQKRGLPHAHILIVLQDQDKPRTREIIDKLVSAEIPDITVNPRLRAIVLKHMIHGPCGVQNGNSPCMENKKCTKDFPKQFQEETSENIDGYPQYRRRATAPIRIGQTNKFIDNRWVVPYNPYLLLTFNCHLNVEVCVSIKSVKYLFKYVYKGHDCANVEMVVKTNTGDQLNHDEIKSHIDSRYVSAPEAIWRLFGFKLHSQSHHIQRLAIHQENQQNVYFIEGNEQNAVQNVKDSTLSAWFKLNRDLPEYKRYLYSEIPEHCVFDEKLHKWKPRQKGHGTIIGRMYSVSPTELERFYLRVLLLNVPGATSFTDLKTVGNVVYSTFKEAACHRGLVSDDTEWDKALSDAASFRMPRSLRQLFAYICVFCMPTNALLLWNKYKPDFIEDFCLQTDNSSAENLALKDINDTLILHGKRNTDYGLPQPSIQNTFTEFFTFNKDIEKQLSEQYIAQLNQGQKLAFETVMLAIDDETCRQRCFYLQGCGGSGKTFVYNTLMSTIRARGDTVLAVASTGIAANLLKGGRTYHSTFKLPVPFFETSVSNVKGDSVDAKIIKAAKLIVWDECTMTPYVALNEVNRLLKELMNNDLPFGGKVVLLGGDFAQCLNVVKRGNRVKIVQSCLKMSNCWKYFKTLKLTENMRTNADEIEFANWLLRLGRGHLKNDYDLGEDVIEIPEDMICRGSLVEQIFGSSFTAENSFEFANRAILCPKNDDTLKINEDVLQRLDGEIKTYKSVDTVLSDNEQERADYPEEFLNSLTPSGMPPHIINLKVGAIIMLLRNLNTKRGLCNGTRLIVRSLVNNIVFAEVLTGSAKGEHVFIPRIDLAPSDADVPFTLKRRALPIRLSWAMTCCKAQGQSLDKVGIYLPAPVFAHGMLYVAFSRATTKNGVRVKVLPHEQQGELLPNSTKVFTQNVVYREVFDL